MGRGKSWSERYPNPHTRPDLDDPFTARMRASAKSALGHDVLESQINLPDYIAKLQRMHSTPEYQEAAAKGRREAEASEANQREMVYRRNISTLSPFHVRAVTNSCRADLTPVTTTDIQRKVLDQWDDKQHMFLLGTTGIGKTFTATWCAMRAALRGVDVAATTATRVCEASPEKLAQLRSAGVLVIDQLHTLRSPAGKDMPAWKVSPVIDLIDYRYEQMATMICAGTVGPEAMVDILGEDVQRRFECRLVSESTAIRTDKGRVR